jgi:hypothetical protein
MTLTNEVIQLSRAEIQTLSTLCNQAELAAPALRESLAIRLSKVLSNSQEHPANLAKAISCWFVNLFYSFGKPETQQKRYSKSLVTIQLLVACLDILLHFGNSVTSYAEVPSIAVDAFQKSLAIRMLERQIEDSNSLSRLYEMCLLD